MNPAQNQHHQINAAEFGATDLAATRVFFECVFGLEFTEYGAGQYIDARSGAVTIGFYPLPRSKDTQATQSTLAVSGLLIFYSKDLEHTQAQVERAGGKISTPVFDFPGGRRFHFTEPSGNEFAVWSEPL